MVNDALVEYLEIWGIEGNFAIFSDSSIGFVLAAAPIDISCWDDERVNAYSERLSQFLNGLPEETNIQFLQEISSDNGATFDRHRDLSKNESPISKKLVETRIERLIQLDAEGCIPKHELKVFVRCPMREPLLGKPKIFSRSKKSLVR